MGIWLNEFHVKNWSIQHLSESCDLKSHRLKVFYQPNLKQIGPMSWPCETSFCGLPNLTRINNRLYRSTRLLYFSEEIFLHQNCTLAGAGFSVTKVSLPTKTVSVPWPGQGSVLQADTSVSSPTQSFPPNLGVGLSHVLRRVLKPPPQSALQKPQSPYSLQPPSRGVAVNRGSVIWCDVCVTSHH